MEDRLVEWIHQQQAETNQLLTRCQIKRKAKEISTVNSFKASKGWLDKFRRRHNIEFRPAVSETQFIKSESSLERYEETNSEEEEDTGSNKENQEPFCEEAYIEEQSFSPFKRGQIKLAQSLESFSYEKGPQKDFEYQDFISLSSEQNHYALRMISLEQTFGVKEDDRNM